MPNLKNNLLLLCIFIHGCQSTTPNFNLKTFHSKADDLHVIEVNSDRIRQKCLFFNAEAENNWRHQYLMYVLNDKNEALEIMQPTNQDKDTCYNQIREIKKILQSELRVKLCIRDELKKQSSGSENQVNPIQFGILGTHDVVYQTLTLDSVCNSKKCIRNNDIWIHTCPGFLKP